MTDMPRPSFDRAASTHFAPCGAEDFISALGLRNVDILGYSLGGMVVQQLVANHPDLVGKIVLVGTAPRGGKEHLLRVLDEARSRKGLPDPRLDLFFTKSKRGRLLGELFRKGPGPGRRTKT